MGACGKPGVCVACCGRGCAGLSGAEWAKAFWALKVWLALSVAVLLGSGAGLERATVAPALGEELGAKERAEAAGLLLQLCENGTEVRLRGSFWLGSWGRGPVEGWETGWLWAVWAAALVDLWATLALALGYRRFWAIWVLGFVACLIAAMGGGVFGACGSFALPVYQGGPRCRVTGFLVAGALAALSAVFWLVAALVLFFCCPEPPPSEVPSGPPAPAKEAERPRQSPEAAAVAPKLEPAVPPPSPATDASQAMDPMACREQTMAMTLPQTPAGAGPSLAAATASKRAQMMGMSAADDAEAGAGDAGGLTTGTTSDAFALGKEVKAPEKKAVKPTRNRSLQIDVDPVSLGATTGVPSLMGQVTMPTQAEEDSGRKEEGSGAQSARTQLSSKPSSKSSERASARAKSPGDSQRKSTSAMVVGNSAMISAALYTGEGPSNP